METYERVTLFGIEYCDVETAKGVGLLPLFNYYLNALLSQYSSCVTTPDSSIDQRGA